MFILPFMLLAGWMFGKQPNNNDTDNKNKITRVGDKAWIIGNEFVNSNVQCFFPKFVTLFYYI